MIERSSRKPTIAQPLEDAITEPEAEVSGILSPGQLLASRFRIRRLLGEGAMGLVYEAEDVELGVSVALKLVRRELRTPELLRRLHQEIVLSRRITHTNVCRTYDLGTTDETRFIIMEYVEGETLEQLISSGVPLSTAVKILCEICDALEAAHRQGVVHRDLKPGNIKIDRHGTTKVMDFGLARDVTSEDTVPGTFLGTPAYWSPEQAAGERATERSDIYAAGIVACELFGLGRPLLHEEPRLFGVRRPFRPVLRRCLARHPAARFASAGDLKSALLTAHRHAARPRWPLALAGAAIAGLGIAVRLWLETHSAAPSPALPTPARLETTERTSGASRASGATSALERGAPIGAEEAPQSTRPARPSRPAAAPDTVQRSAGPAPAAPSENDPSAHAAAAALLAQVESDRARRAILVDDVPRYREQRAAAERAIAAGEVGRTAIAVAAMRDALSAVEIDGAFVRNKLERLSALSRRLQADSPEAGAVAAVFRDVHAAYFADDFATANRHLNTIARALEHAD